MTQNERKKLLRNLCNQIRDKLLKQSGEWPDNWDGVELRWLLKQAVDYEQVTFVNKKSKRWQEFKNDWSIRNLY